MKLYEITVDYQTTKKIKVMATDRQHAIEKASKKLARQGIEATGLCVPYLDGEK